MEGKSQQERKKVRNKLGSLKGLTVQPRTPAAIHRKSQQVF